MDTDGYVFYNPSPIYILHAVNSEKVASLDVALST